MDEGTRPAYVQALQRALAATQARLVTDRQVIQALLLTYNDNADPSQCPAVEGTDWAREWMGRLAGRKPPMDPTEESAEEIQDSFDQALQEELEQVENFNRREAARQEEQDLRTAERYMQEKAAQDAQQEDDRTMQLAMGLSYRRPQQKTRVRRHTTVGANERSTELNVSAGEPVTVTMQTLTVHEPGQWYENGAEIPWWVVPTELRDNTQQGAASSTGSRPSWAQSRSLRGEASFNLDDPLVYGYYKQWTEKKITAEKVVAQGGQALLSFFEACLQLEDSSRALADPEPRLPATAVTPVPRSAPSDSEALMDTVPDVNDRDLMRTLSEVEAVHDPEQSELPGFDDVHTSD